MGGEVKKPTIGKIEVTFTERKCFYEIYDDQGELMKKITTMKFDDGDVEAATEERTRMKCKEDEGVSPSREDIIGSSKFSKFASAHLWLFLELTLLCAILCLYMGSFG